MTPAASFCFRYATRLRSGRDCTCTRRQQHPPNDFPLHRRQRKIHVGVHKKNTTKQKKQSKRVYRGIGQGGGGVVAGLAGGGGGGGGGGGRGDAGGGQGQEDGVRGRGGDAARDVVEFGRVEAEALRDAQVRLAVLVAQQHVGHGRLAGRQVQLGREERVLQHQRPRPRARTPARDLRQRPVRLQRKQQQVFP